MDTRTLPSLASLKVRLVGDRWVHFVEGHILAGDFQNEDGTGGQSLFGYPFPDESYELKDNKKGYTVLFDWRLVLFILNCHLTPQGMIDLETLFKNPRPIFDSSFRPFFWCMAINDWTTKETEPRLTFSAAEVDDDTAATGSPVEKIPPFRFMTSVSLFASSLHRS